MRFFPISRFVSRWLFLLLLLTAYCGVQAQMLNLPQQDNSSDSWDVGINLGTTQFFGDAANHNYFRKWSGESRLGVQIYAKRMISPVFGLGLNIFSTGVSSIKDRKSDGTAVDYSLWGNYDDLSLFGYANFSNLFGGTNSDRRFSVYGTLGFGISTWNTALTDNISGIVLRSGTTSGGSRFTNKAFVVPFGAGFDYRINDKWSVRAGGTMTTIFSDYVDEWKGGAKNDQLFYSHLGVTYYIHPGKHDWLRKKSRRRNKRSEEDMNKRPIPIYDYMVNPGPTPGSASGGQPEVDVMSLPLQPPAAPVKTAVQQTPPPTASHEEQAVGLRFRIQVLASRVPMDPLLMQKKYHFEYPVKVFHQDGLYRFTVGQFTSYHEALNESLRLRGLGVTGAFVTAYRDGMRVPLTKAMMK